MALWVKGGLDIWIMSDPATSSLDAADDVAVPVEIVTAMTFARVGFLSTRRWPRSSIGNQRETQT